MFIELLDALRCVREHEDGWLVAAARHQSSRHLLEGVIGCPVCRAEYPVHDAVADFTAGGELDPPAPDAKQETDAAPEQIFRAGGLLGLTDVRGPVVLTGEWAMLAPGLAELVAASYIAVNGGARMPLRPELSELRVHRALPLAPAAVHAVALDAKGCAAGLLRHAVRVLRQRGRLVAPVTSPLPDDVRELARDDRHWVAERLPLAGATIQLARATPP